MLLNFDLLKNSLSKVEEDEQARIQMENSYIRVLEAKNLRDVEDVSTEELVDIMLSIHEYTREMSSASSVVSSLLYRSRLAKRVATGRLL